MKNQDKFFLIIAILGFLAFFMPWFTGGIIGNYSGYSLFIHKEKLGITEIWLLVLFPISFLIAGLSKLNLVKYRISALTKIVELIPITLILTLTLILFEEIKDSGVGELFNFGISYEYIFQMLGIGLLLTLISSILIVFAPIQKESLNK